MTFSHPIDSALAPRPRVGRSGISVSSRRIRFLERRVRRDAVVGMGMRVSGVRRGGVACLDARW
jgi:hypothetical protein